MAAAIITALFAVSIVASERKMPRRFWPIWVGAALLTLVICLAVKEAP
jgi:predicted membrane-bound dolichyl-phosphate-mannose-protein mannosyltransferase